MSPASIGINLRVTGHCSQGGRKYMEDFFSVAYQQSEDEKDLEYAFFGIFDGHGGSEAAKFAKEHLMNEIVNQKLFWSDNDDDVLRAIREGYIQTHYAMWRKQEKWPKTTTGLPSTAGTTASIAFIRKGKIYIGHVGDSGIILGYQENGEKCWKAKPLTQDHKPECHIEKARIMNSGGKVVTKSGVPRVVWNRPRVGHKGPVRRSTPFDEIPFLAVARSLGDLWSYNSALNQFVVSPDPDVCVVKIDPKTFRCLIFGTDGLWNVISSNDSIDIARDAEIINERLAYMSGGNVLSNDWRNPSKCLVDKALERWHIRKMRADNTSVVTVMLDPPGLPKKDISRQCSTTSYGLEYIQMDGEINSNDDDYRTITNIHNSDQYSHIITNNQLHHHQDMIMQNCYSQSSQNSSCGNDYSNVLQRYDNNSCDNFSYYDNNSMMDNSSSNYVFENCSTSTSSTTPAPTTSNHQSDMYSNGISFAESYNSLLISSLENENSSSSRSSSSGDSSGDELDVQHIYQSLNETGLAGHDHVYRHYPNINNQQQQQQYQQACMLDEDGYSLTKLETRCEQRLRNINNNNNSNICGGGVAAGPSNNINNSSNLKNSVRIDQQQQQQTRQITFQNNNNNIENCQISSPTNYNQYDNITSSFRSPANTNLSNAHISNSNYIVETTPKFEQPLQQQESTESENVILNECVKKTQTTTTTTTTVCENIISIPLIKDDNKSINNILDENSKNQIEIILDESIQINEISSSFSEINSPLPSPSSCNNMKEYKNCKFLKDNNNDDDIDMIKPMKPKMNNQNRIRSSSQKSTTSKIITTPITRNTRASKLLYSIKQNVENISITETKQPIRYTKRTLRSRNSLSKDLKAKTTTNKKSTIQQHLKRSITDEYLKSVVVNPNPSATTVVASTTTSLCKLRSRQHQQQQQKSEQQVAIWPITRSRRTTTNYSVPSKSSALCANNNNNTRLRNNINNINLRNSNNTVTSSSCSTYRNNNNSRLHTKLIQSSPSSSVSSTSTKRSLASRNSAWCPSKNAVQTRNRVQKR